MGFQNIMISSNAKLNIKNQQLVIDNGEISTIPLEDINTLLIESRAVTVSTYLLTAAAEAGVAVYMCDDKHLPSTVVLPLSIHSRHFKMLKSQMNISKPFQKRLWQQIVVQKIRNQALCLKLAEKEGSDELMKMSREVQSGDATHVESKAAAFYFPKLYYVAFKRSDENIFNTTLNYCYAIIRGMIARSIVNYGFEPSIGLFHKSEQNSFNLADDFIEPYRPLVDLMIAKKFDSCEKHVALTPEIKREIFGIMNYDMLMKGEEKHVISHCIDMQVASFNTCLMAGNGELLLPELMQLQVHSYE